MTTSKKETHQTPLKVIILGSGAIGNALAQVILTHNSGAHCIITYHRNPPSFQHPRLTSMSLNALHEDEFITLKDNILSTVGSIDWIINTIGILHDKDKGIFPEKRLLDFNTQTFTQVLEHNVLPTVYAAKHLTSLFEKKNSCIFAAISAKVGSIEDNRQGGWYSYRASKACLNMMIKTIAIELAHKNKKTCVLALHPGTTDSHLSEPFQKNVPEGKLFTPERTAKQLINILYRVTPDNTGSFYSWDGALLPW
ncbi:SDR family NAD(P)-dependent oxidoreductase [Marinagarivorans algicola]|uniref:SDR family NAD(P)-dependent oxidoreductase n=1 Tax=Marinagarivorans algicola TaxID=1513270 RepID=UPI003735691F